jgi:hypothetical protein
MRLALLALSVCCFCLSGCDFLRMILPHKTTTPAEALNAMQQCGVSPDNISWRVTEDGAFAFGRKSADALPIPDGQTQCLMKWARDNRVEVRFIGWKTDES